MKILILCTKYSLEAGSPWLTNELAEALSGMGHKVDVLCIDWSTNPGKVDSHLSVINGVRVNMCAPAQVMTRNRFVRLLYKWVVSSFRANRLLGRLLREERYDFVVGFSPAVTMALPLIRATRWLRVPSVLVQWDFFPYHHQQIGLIKSGIVFSAAKKAEEFLMRGFDIIACMSPANISYLKRNYKLKSKQQAVILPVWGRDEVVPAGDTDQIKGEYGIPKGKKLVAFGGQLVQGRGLEDLLRVAEMASKSLPDVVFLVVGSGPLECLIKDYVATGAGNLIWIPWLSRLEYLRLIKVCDVGLVCTVRNVDVPSFPSKTIDYLRSGVPILASVERTTDYGVIIDELGVGVRVEAGDPEQFMTVLKSLLENEGLRQKMSLKGPEVFRRNFDVCSVSNRLLELFKGVAEGKDVTDGSGGFKS